jgi:hypothetical protein
MENNHLVDKLTVVNQLYDRKEAEFRKIAHERTNQLEVSLSIKDRKLKE